MAEFSPTETSKKTVGHTPIVNFQRKGNSALLNDRKQAAKVHAQNTLHSISHIKTLSHETNHRTCGYTFPSQSYCPFGGACHTCPARVQAKLKVNQPGDKYEREADQIAESIMSVHVPAVQRKGCQGCKDEEEEEAIQTKPISQRITPLIQRQAEEDEEDDAIQTKQIGVYQPVADASIIKEINNSRGNGTNLSSDIRYFMERRFGADFSDVRVHVDSHSDGMNNRLNARAFTLGRDIYFNTEHYRPNEPDGKKLLAHELTHVVQQSNMKPRKCIRTKNGEKSGNQVTSHSLLNAVQIQPQHRLTNPIIMRSLLFTSTMKICHRLLKSRVFHVSNGGLRVTAGASWEASSRWQGKEAPSCGEKYYFMTLSQVGTFLDKELGSCEFAHDKAMTQTWTNLPEGDYYLTIWTNNTNPNCCLSGNIKVSQETGMTGPNCAGGSVRTIAVLSSGEKISAALRYAVDNKLSGEAGKRIKELLSPESIAMMVAFTSAYVISQTTPIGWVADILVAGLIAATVLMVGEEAIEIIKLLIEFFKKASNAKNQMDIEEAAELFAKAVSKFGVDIIVAILFHKAGKAANLKPPGPRTQGLVEVLKVGGGKLKTTILNPPVYADYVTTGNIVIRIPIDAMPGRAMMMESRGIGGSSVKTGGKGVTAKGKQVEPKTTETQGKLPGKETVSATGLKKKKPIPTEESPVLGESPNVFRLGPTPYGHGELSQLAQRMRLKLGIRSGGNVAVYEFEGIPSEFKSFATRLGGDNVLFEGNRMAVQNVSGSAHSEQLAHMLIVKGRLAGIKLKNPLQIYTEYNPCTNQCLPLIQRSYPNVKVTYSFIWEYWGRQTPDRNAEIDALFAAHEGK